MNKHYVTYSELIDRCNSLVKDIKLAVDTKNGFEKHVYKVTGLSKNDLIIASIFSSKLNYSFFDFELEYNPLKSDFIIKDIIKTQFDYGAYHIPVFGVFNYLLNPLEYSKGVLVFPWERMDLNEIANDLERLYDIDENKIDIFEDAFGEFFEDLIEKCKKV